MKSFLQYITEAGIRRKVRVADSKKLSPREKVGARADVKGEQDKRTPRVIKRAKQEAEASEPLPTVGGIHAHAERLERVGQKVAGYASQMADVEKPGFVRARNNRLLSPRGNDGY